MYIVFGSIPKSLCKELKGIDARCMSVIWKILEAKIKTPIIILLSVIVFAASCGEHLCLRAPKIK